ncbi:expressed unknown protein [Seminavis robusta]|uniref:Uncharacterized protein n=1 Tax=Seminavis robusta TaxID=568900 RepID=A0A9N8HXW6_9STRA|nr:expressed unknown protein [Seminavis robusta]|eukprot:Sro2643_g333500.1 n/a (698) ;mRNA; f:4267-6453
MKILLVLPSLVALLTAVPSLASQAQAATDVSSVSSTSQSLDDTAQAELVAMKEVMYVNIVDPKADEVPFNDRAPEILPKRSDLYITFRHRGKDWGQTIPFGVGEDAWVNIPLLANATGLQEPVICKVKQPRKLMWDKTLYTAKLFLGEDVGEGDETILHRLGEINAILRNGKGDDSGLCLKLSTYSTEWDSIYIGRQYKPKKLDAYFTLFLKFLKVQVKALNLGGAGILTKPSQPANTDLPTISMLNGRIEFPKQDEFIPLDWKAKYVPPLLNMLPVTKTNNPIYNRPRSMNRVRLALGSGVTSPYEGKWDRDLSDASMHRVYFCSMGMFYLKKDNSTNGYVADMEYFNKLKYKKGYDSIAHRTFFDANGIITKIEDSDGTMYHPGDENWEWAKLKSRAAAFTYASLEHVTSYHYTWACTPALGLRMFLPPAHPIRMAFSAHMFRTHYTCAKAKDSLLSEVGVLGRILPFTYKDGLEKAYIDLLDNYTFVPYPEELKNKGLANCPFHVGASDGVALHKVMMDYAANLFDEVYGTEANLQADGGMRDLHDWMRRKMRDLPKDYTMAHMKKIWGEILFRVTGAHTSIGNAVPYAIDPLVVNFRLQKEDKGKAYGSEECNAGVAGITGLTIPSEYPTLSQDWSQVLKNPKSKAYAQLHVDLKALGKKIDAENDKVNSQSTKRRFVNRDFHPEHAALSTFA